MTLEVVEQAALAGGGAEAERIVASARARAEAMLEEARAEAASLIERRRSAAERLAELEQQASLAQARADARATVLRAQREVLLGAHRDARLALGRMLEDPRYAELLVRLAADARRRLAGPAPVRTVAAPDGGLRVIAGSRELDYSLRAQLERSLRALSAESERLWR